MDTKIHLSDWLLTRGGRPDLGNTKLPLINLNINDINDIENIHIKITMYS